MAERRMLHRAASTSPDLTWLRTKHGSDAALFAVLLIPFYDRWGCVPADPARLRAMVVPSYDDIAAADVKRWIDAMVRRGMLVKVTSPEGERGLRNPSFHDHQAGVQWEREAVSPWEPPEITERWQRGPRGKRKDADTRGGHRVVSDQSESGLSEGKGSTSPLPPTARRRRTRGPAASPDPSPGAQAQPPGRQEVNGKRHRDEPARILDALTPETRAVVERGMAAAAAREAGE